MRAPPQTRYWATCTSVPSSRSSPAKRRRRNSPQCTGLRHGKAMTQPQAPCNRSAAAAPPVQGRLRLADAGRQRPGRWRCAAARRSAAAAGPGRRATQRPARRLAVKCANCCRRSLVLPWSGQVTSRRSPRLRRQARRPPGKRGAAGGHLTTPRPDSGSFWSRSPWPATLYAASQAVAAPVRHVEEEGGREALPAARRGAHPVLGGLEPFVRQHLRAPRPLGAGQLRAGCVQQAPLGGQTWAMSPTLITKAPGSGCTVCHSPLCSTSRPGVPSWARTVSRPASLWGEMPRPACCAPPAAGCCASVLRRVCGGLPGCIVRLWGR